MCVVIKINTQNKKQKPCLSQCVQRERGHRRRVVCRGCRFVWESVRVFAKNEPAKRHNSNPFFSVLSPRPPPNTTPTMAQVKKSTFATKVRVCQCGEAWPRARGGPPAQIGAGPPTPSTPPLSPAARPCQTWQLAVRSTQMPTRTAGKGRGEPDFDKRARSVAPPTLADRRGVARRRLSVV